MVRTKDRQALAEELRQLDGRPQRQQHGGDFVVIRRVAAEEAVGPANVGMKSREANLLCEPSLHWHVLAVEYTPKSEHNRVDVIVAALLHERDVRLTRRRAQAAQDILRVAGEPAPQPQPNGDPFRRRRGLFRIQAQLPRRFRPQRDGHAPRSLRGRRAIGTRTRGRVLEAEGAVGALRPVTFRVRFPLELASGRRGAHVASFARSQEETNVQCFRVAEGIDAGRRRCSHGPSSRGGNHAREERPRAAQSMC
mmetsp:Transcript_111958/g.316465  ORF Transcript_111958/g.316465 Transcript_111958/m.316465 type:complete len:252 (-) Transcript_111958:9-764(-)